MTDPRFRAVDHAGTMDPIEQMAEEGHLIGPPSSTWRSAGRRLLRRRTGVAGLIIIGLLVLVAIFAPLLAPYDPEVGLLGEEGEERRSAPCIHIFGCPEDQPQHIMGLDSNARDVFSRIVYGSRVSLTIGFTTVTAAILVGAVLGAIAGFWGGMLDNSVMRVMDVVLGFPGAASRHRHRCGARARSDQRPAGNCHRFHPRLRQGDARLGPPDQGTRLRGGL